jgi:peptidyl-Lys metalloendopeptidase
MKLTMLALTAVPNALAGDGFSTSIRQNAQKTTLAGQVPVEFTVSVESDFHFEVAYTPLEGLFDDVLTVTDNASGRALPYEGKVAHRADFIDTSVFIRAGGSLTKIVDIADGYYLKPGANYTVEYDSIKATVQVSDSFEATCGDNLSFIDDNGYGCWAYVGYSCPREVRENCELSCGICEATEPPPMYYNCDANEVAFIEEAEDEAVLQVEGARSMLSGGYEATVALYNLWFGAYDRTRFENVVADYDLIGGAMRNSRYMCNDNCPGIYAYVYPSDVHQTVYLCGVFWQNCGPATIVHEVSHFNVLAGTSDYAYGESNVKRLARENPDRAVKNADTQSAYALCTQQLDSRLCTP